MTMRPERVPICLTIAGTDPSGGAGINADLQVFRDLGSHGLAAITAVVWQNTQKIGGWRAMEPSELRDQLELVIQDFDIGALKIGMLPRADLVEEVSAFLERLDSDVSVVLDPVMVGGRGIEPLMDDGARACLKQLASRVDLVTPNGPEALRLAGVSNSAMKPETVVQTLLDRGWKRVLLKGGHLRDGDTAKVVDWYGDSGPIRALAGVEPVAADVRGTGCQLSSAIVALRAKGQSWEQAIDGARAYLYRLLIDQARVISHGRPVVVRVDVEKSEA